MVIVHSYVSLPEGKSGLSFLRCQWEGQGLTIGDFFASRSVSTAMWCSYTKSTLAIAHPRALWFCSPTFQKSRGLWLTKHASLANKTYKTAINRSFVHPTWSKWHSLIPPPVLFSRPPAAARLHRWPLGWRLGPGRPGVFPLIRSIPSAVMAIYQL